MDSAPGETADFLISSATRHGQPVSPAMLKQWRDAGLLPRPVQRSQGRGKGTATVYPAGTTAQLRRILDIRAEDGQAGRRFDRDAAFWRLWWEGWAIEPRQVRARLTDALTGWELALTAFADDDDGSLTDSFRTARLPPLLARARKRVGTSKMDTVAALMRGSLDGTAPGRWQDDDDASTLLTALGLDGAVRSLAPDAPRFTADLAGDLHRFGRAVAPNALRLALDAAVPGDIDQARTDLRSIIEAFRVVWHVAGTLFTASGNASNTGEDLFTIREQDGLDYLPVATLLMLALRRDGTYAGAFDALRDLTALGRAVQERQ